MSFLKFDVQVDTWVTREGDPNDEWDNDSTNGNVEVVGCALAERDGYHVLQTKVDLNVGDKIWLVWAQYSTGDSFGSYGGQCELCSVCSTEQEAQDEVRKFELTDDYSVPWNGYFESLDFIRHQEFEVQE